MAPPLYTEYATLDGMRILLEASMKLSIARTFERVAGGILLLAGVTWLALGLQSLSGGSFVARGAAIVALIASLLMLAGVMLVKPRSSSAGRVVAAIVCLLGGFRELMLMSNQPAMSLESGAVVGLGLVSLYLVILIVVVVNHVVERRTAPA